VIVFVSYARQDNDLDVLRRIERHVTALGRPYVDDLHGHEGHSRREAVEQALSTAGSFVAVLSPNYLTTAWTRKEFDIATCRGIPLLALRIDGTFADRPSLPLPLENLKLIGPLSQISRRGRWSGLSTDGRAGPGGRRYALHPITPVLSELTRRRLEVAD
jgi:hypothetical protein